MAERILIIGSNGQIGTELLGALRNQFGNDQVVATDLQFSKAMQGPHFVLDAMNAQAVYELVKNQGITQIYLLAAMLSATAEKFPHKGWSLNMDTLFTCLELAREGHIKKLYWPSSIAVFGPTTPRENTPQATVTEPSTIYGISKFAGERWCEWYHLKHGVDVRSLRYPGLISYSSPPGGGTTDYAVDIFHKAKAEGRYTSFLSANTALPMMYMPDAIRATLELMEAPVEKIKQRGSYNVGALSFTPAELSLAIQKHIPGFEIGYAPDFRQQIADSWPKSIDDTAARIDWGWEPAFNLEAMVSDMFAHI
ncbi:MAG: NAD-dependent epimerase/dehydratase family protein [Bacteroidetes bacterium]|jgi:nucleoside-diphosphate-sugar epimerase|nr:NAD-dependent epimerase/dehydratase family protein [Bacteroidota bacterium]